MVSISIGVLIGFGLLLPYLQDQTDYKIKIGHALAYLFLVVIVFKSIPIIKTSALLTHISIAMKFMFVIILILYAVPTFDKTLFQNRLRKK